MAVDTKKIIKDLGDTNWSTDNESQMKAVQLLKGLSLSDDPLANKFMKAMDIASTKLAKLVLSENGDEDKEEEKNESVMTESMSFQEMLKRANNALV